MTDKTASSENYSFEHNGETYTFEQSLDVVRSPKWLRANRRRDELDLAFTVIEEIGGVDVVEVIDGMTTEEFKVFTKDLMKELNATFRG
jgi:hypothetical protein